MEERFSIDIGLIFLVVAWLYFFIVTAQSIRAGNKDNMPVVFAIFMFHLGAGIIGLIILSGLFSFHQTRLIFLFAISNMLAMLVRGTDLLEECLEKITYWQLFQIFIFNSVIVLASTSLVIFTVIYFSEYIHRHIKDFRLIIIYGCSGCVIGFAGCFWSRKNINKQESRCLKK